MEPVRKMSFLERIRLERLVKANHAHAVPQLVEQKIPVSGYRAPFSILQR